MATAINLHEGVIRPSLVTELDAYRAASDQQISSYYVDVNVRHWGGNDAVRVAVIDWLAGEREEMAETRDDVPAKVRFPDPFTESRFMHKRTEEVHHHFENAAEAALRLFEREPFEHLIIGGRPELLSQFESHLHRYLRDRIMA